MQKRIAINIRGETACAEVVQGVRRYAQGRADWSIRASEAEKFGSKMNRERLLAWEPHALIFNGRYDGTFEGFRSRISGPIISLHRYDLDTPSVCVDQRAVGRLLAEHLLELGLRHVAFFQQTDLPFDVDCAAGFSEVVEKEKLTPILVPPMALASQAWDEIDREYFEALSKLPMPVGIATSNDENAKRINDACTSHNLAMPEDIALVGVGNEKLLCDCACRPFPASRCPRRKWDSAPPNCWTACSRDSRSPTVRNSSSRLA